VGRFITRDTYLDQAPYAYCDGDPVNATDPSGHTDQGLIGAGIGIAIGTVAVAGLITAGIIILPLGAGIIMGGAVGGLIGGIIGGLFAPGRDFVSVFGDGIQGLGLGTLFGAVIGNGIPPDDSGGGGGITEPLPTRGPVRSPLGSSPFPEPA